MRVANTAQGTSRFVATKHLQVAEEGGRTILLDLKSSRYYGLDEVGGRIWELVSQGATLQGIIDHMQAEYDVSTAQLTSDVNAFLARLLSSGLIEVSSGDGE